MQDALGDRIKANYEQRQRPMLTRRMPVIVRIDGRAFHTYTKGFDKPFDVNIYAIMVKAALAVAREMQGCQAVYLQSDEASFLLTDYDTLQTDAWFGYNQQKLCSIAASVFTARFNISMHYLHNPAHSEAHFDARAFNIPREEVCNYFLWRARDWARNSVNMLGRAYFSHKELTDKTTPEIHEMLHTKNVNWAKLEGWQKNGSWLLRTNLGWTTTANLGWTTTAVVEPVYDQINALLARLIYPGGDDDRNHTASISANPGAENGVSNADIARTRAAECDANRALHDDNG